MISDRAVLMNENDLDIIKEIMKLTVAAESFEELAQMIVEKCADLLDAELCTLWRRVKEDGQDKLYLGASKGFQRKPGEEIPKYVLNWDASDDREVNGVTAWIAIRQRAICFKSYKKLSKHPSHRGYWDRMTWDSKAETKFRSLIGIPLIVYNKGSKISRLEDSVVGVLKLENKAQKDVFSKDDFTLAKNLAPFIAIALEAMNVREGQEEHRQRILKQLTASLLRPFEPQVLYKQIVDTTASLLNADICSLWLCNSDKSSLKLAAATGVKSNEEDTPVYNLNWQAQLDNDIDGLTAWVAIRKKSFFARYFEDLQQNKSWRGKWDKAQWDNIPWKYFGSLYAVPLVINEEVLGVLKIERRQPKPPFSDINNAIFDLMADFIELGLELGSRLRQDIIFDYFHILKQPMSTCSMIFDDLRRELDRPDGPREERIEKRLRQMAIMLETVRGWTNNVYLLASEEVIGDHEEPRNINLDKILKKVLRDLQSLFPLIKYEISKDIASYSLNLSPIEEKKMEVILWNIFSNSIKYSTNTPVIIVTTRENSEKLELILKDKGQGISPDDLPYIFKPNFTRGMKKWPESLGLGLATVDRLLQKFNWDRRVESVLGQGTEFILILPKEVWRKDR